MKIPVGTRSLLWGSHQFLLHPILVAIAWRRIYGSWPGKLPIWLAIVVHDWGYWGLGDMDGDDGKRHPYEGATLVSRLFDYGYEAGWFRFTAGHSRYYAAMCGFEPSTLMRADKYATVLCPLPLYVLLVLLSGEWREYVDYHHRKTGSPRTFRGWLTSMRRDWACYGPDTDGPPYKSLKDRTLVP